MRSLRHALLPLATLSAALLWPSPAPSQDAPPPDRWSIMSQRLDAVWVLDMPVATARQTVDGAIDEAVNAMNMMLRGVARPMIRDNTPVNREIELRFREGQNIFVRFDTRARYTTPLGATRTVRTPEGDSMRMTQHFRGENLEQVFQADNGTRWNTYIPLPDGRMRVDAVTQGAMMPQAMRFSLTYRRQ
ncbi:MAG: hypothetical protein KF729_28785 [Sandaracinaceae bacterium]|nr:hypothetical protein [Sandaracinaceae bacterium]